MALHEELSVDEMVEKIMENLSLKTPNSTTKQQQIINAQRLRDYQKRAAEHKENALIAADKYALQGIFLLET